MLSLWYCLFFFFYCAEQKCCVAITFIFLYSKLDFSCRNCNASNFLFMHSLLIFCFKTQVILATNVAESSVTVPDVKYGKFLNLVILYTLFVIFSILVLGLLSRICHCSKSCCWSVEFSFTTLNLNI